jgi:hypothetical protein
MLIFFHQFSDGYVKIKEKISSFKLGLLTDKQGTVFHKHLLKTFYEYMHYIFQTVETLGKISSLQEIQVESIEQCNIILHIDIVVCFQPKNELDFSLKNT